MILIIVFSSRIFMEFHSSS